MRTGAAAGHRGYFHEAALYGSDTELAAIAVPFLRDGLDAGEPGVVALTPANTALVRAAMPDAHTELMFVAGPVGHGNPAAAIAAYRAALTDLAAAGATQIRLVGEVPHPGNGAPWDWWARYEATANHAFDDVPAWGICPYDTRTTPAAVLDDVLATHPYLATPDGRHLPNPRYRPAEDFLASRPAPAPDPIEATPPLIELVDPTPAAARRAVQALNTTAPINAEDFAYAVNEAVSNALRHGQAPVRLRLWAGPDRAVATITDRGHGPTDPYVGLLPATSTTGGLGLWMTHQMCNHVSFGAGEDGFTIRLTAGSPHVVA